MAMATAWLMMSKLHEFLRPEKRLEMVHLPQSRQAQDSRLSDSPPKDAAVCGLARRPETLFSVTLIVLLLGDLLHLIQQLADAQLQLGQLVFRRDLSVIVRMLANLNVKMDSKLTAAEPGGGIGMKADDVFARQMAGECEAPLGAVLLG